MGDSRKYDRALVEAIRTGQRIVEQDGMSVMLKPIPDDSREHVLDPRVRAVVERKRSMFAERAKETAGAFSLANERWRPDKVTYDLNEGDVEVSERLIEVDGTHRIDVFTYRPKGAGDIPAYVFLHGGGFTAGNERIYHNQMRYLAETSGALVVFPDYRLAPESPFPAAIEDCVATVRWVRDNAEELGVDQERIMVGGDSAGGSLSCACALEDNEKIIKRVYLLFPGCDMSNYHEQRLYSWSYDLYPVVDGDRKLAFSRIERIRCGCEGTSEESNYVQGKTSLSNPLVSVVFATDEQLARFPPVTVAVSEYDYLRVGAEFFARRLNGLGREVRLVRYCGCDHGFFDLFGTEPQAEEVCLDMAGEIAKL